MNYTRIVGVLFTVAPLFAQGDKQFSIPVTNLKEWSEKIVVSMPATISGHSKVHDLKSDCEMHFGAAVDGYRGEPDGFVLEPMNLCVVNFFGAKTYSKTQWEKFGDSLVKKSVSAEGVPRIWPEHIEGDASPSNPNHAVELHPLTKITLGSKKFDFSSFVFAPEDYRGGVGAETALSILTDVAVGVTETGGTVNIDFDGGRIGNFTTLDIRFRKPTADGRHKIETLPGGHRAAGEVVLSRTKTVPVSLVTVAGSPFDERVAKFLAGNRATLRVEALVLFSLNPAALSKAATASRGSRVEVTDPIQLIVYGVAEEQ
jgi:hypothetical protein